MSLTYLVESAGRVKTYTTCVITYMYIIQKHRHVSHPEFPERKEEGCDGCLFTCLFILMYLMCLCAHVFIHMELLICSYSQYGVMLKAGFSVNKKEVVYPVRTQLGKKHNHSHTLLTL